MPMPYSARSRKPKVEKKISLAMQNKLLMVKNSWNKDYEEATAVGKRIRHSKLHPSAVYKHPP